MATSSSPNPPASRLNTSTLIIGESKAGKTTLLATFAEYLWEEYQKVLFLYSCGLGGFSARVEQRIRQGLIRPFRMRTRDDKNSSLSFETAQLCSKGYVPAKFTDALTGEVAEGCRMVPPVQARFKQTCQGCGAVVRDTAFEAVLKSGTCPQCKRPITLQNSDVVRYTKRTAGFEQIGSFGYDDLTSMSDWYLQDMSHRKLGGEASSLGEIVSGDEVFRGNNRAQVGMAQTRVHELVANSLGITGLVVLPVWVALSEEATDESGRLPVIGPKLAGSAKTYIAPSWFGNCLEAAVVDTGKPEEQQRVLYLSSFVDDMNRKHLLGHRGDPRFMPQVLEDAPYKTSEAPQEYCTGFSLAHFYRLLHESVEKGRQADDHLSGPPVPSSYGDVEEVEPPQASGARPSGTPVKARLGGRARPKPAGAGSGPESPSAEPSKAEAEPPAGQEEGAAAPTTPSEGSTAENTTPPSTLSAAPVSAVAGVNAAPPAAPLAPRAPAATRFPRPPGPRPAAPRAPQAGPGTPPRPGQS